jgi:hypothetical protein
MVSSNFCLNLNASENGHLDEEGKNEDKQILDVDSSHQHLGAQQK